MTSKAMGRTILAAGAALLTAAALLCAQTGGFRWDGPISRVITPNGDGLNDKAFFCFDNFADSDVSGMIYTMLGAEVATMQSRQNVNSFAARPQCPSGNKEQVLIWDPLSQGQVHSGVYVYRVTAEGRAFSGTMVVVR